MVFIWHLFTLPTVGGRVRTEWQDLTQVRRRNPQDSERGYHSLIINVSSSWWRTPTKPRNWHCGISFAPVYCVQLISRRLRQHHCSLADRMDAAIDHFSLNCPPTLSVCLCVLPFSKSPLLRETTTTTTTTSELASHLHVENCTFW